MEIRVKKENHFGKLLYICTIKAAIERAKSRMLFELFRAEAGSNEVQFKTTTFMEATTTKRRRTSHPMSYYREMVKDMDNSQKLELVSILIESVKPIQTRTVFDMPLEEDFPDMDKELYTAEEAYELTMQDIKAIYDENNAI